MEPCQRYHRTVLCHHNTKEQPRYWWRRRTRSRYMKIPYLGNCKPSNCLNDTLKASNWCLREPKKHVKRSRWSYGQLVQQVTINTELQVEVLVVLVHDCLACCTNCPPNYLDLFACSLGSLRHQFDASRMSFEWLNSFQLSEYVIFIWWPVLLVHQYMGYSLMFWWYQTVQWHL